MLDNSASTGWNTNNPQSIAGGISGLIIANNDSNTNTNLSEYNSDDLRDEVISEVGASDLVQIVLLGLLVVISVMGNLLVVSAVIKEQRLRTYTNYFIVSLACADLLVSVVVVPVSIVYQIMRRWIFGQVLCTMYTSLDIMCCTASIINLCAISLDRYWAIVTPFQYQHKMTRRTCPLIIASVWISSALIAVGQIAWRYIMNKLGKIEDSNEDKDQCQISLDLSFRIFSSMSSFYVPLVVMLFTYSRIFAVARRQSKAMAEQLRQCSPIGQQNGMALLTCEGGRRANNNNNNNDKYSSTTRNSLDPNGCHTDETPLNGNGAESRPSRNPSFTSQSRSTRSNSFRAINRMVRRATQFVAKTNPLGQATELKAFKTLSIVMGVFIINWLPFFCLYLVEGVQQRRIDGYWAIVVLWLGYFNSVLNPFIYFFFNKQYKQAFIKLLCPASRRHKFTYQTQMLSV